MNKLSPYNHYLDFPRYIRLFKKPNFSFRVKPRVNNNIFPESGLIQFSQAIPEELCNRALEEYDQFEILLKNSKCSLYDENGRNYRIANLHLESPALREIGGKQEFHDVASNFFGAKSMIYTSLSFKYGTQQKPHIDTPFFWTRPFNLFVGVWVALEDINLDAGPLIYYPGSQNYYSSEEELGAVFEEANRDVQLMFDLMTEKIQNKIRPVQVIIKKGDVVCWHPGLLHGGMKAINSRMTRRSAVFHFTPFGVNVRDHNVFPNNFLNYPTYGVINDEYGVYCRVGKPAIMI